jgi:hypothetical protein
MSIVLYPAAAAKPTRPFGRGILPTAPVYRSDVSAADRAWWTAATLGAESARDFDLEAGSAECVDRMGRGLAIL